MTIGLVTALTIVVISEQMNDRSLVCMAEDIWILPFLIALYWLPEEVNPWVTYVRPSKSLLVFACVKDGLQETGSDYMMYIWRYGEKYRP